MSWKTPLYIRSLWQYFGRLIIYVDYSVRIISPEWYSTIRTHFSKLFPFQPIIFKNSLQLSGTLYKRHDLIFSRKQKWNMKLNYSSVNGALEEWWEPFYFTLVSCYIYRLHFTPWRLLDSYKPVLDGIWSLSSVITFIESYWFPLHLFSLVFSILVYYLQYWDIPTLLNTLVLACVKKNYHSILTNFKSLSVVTVPLFLTSSVIASVLQLYLVNVAFLE